MRFSAGEEQRSGSPLLMPCTPQMRPQHVVTPYNGAGSAALQQSAAMSSFQGMLNCPCLMLSACMCNGVVHKFSTPAALSGSASIQGASKPPASRCCAAVPCSSSKEAWMSHPYLSLARLAHVSKHPWACTLMFCKTLGMIPGMTAGTPALRTRQRGAQNGRPADESQNRTPPGKSPGQSGRTNRLFASDNSAGLRFIPYAIPYLTLLRSLHWAARRNTPLSRPVQV